MIRPCSLICLLLLCTIVVHAQTQPQPPAQRGVQISVGFDGINYQGDFSSDTRNWRVTPGLHLSLQAAKDGAIKLRAQLGIGQFDGQVDSLPAIGEDPQFVSTRLIYGDLGIRWQPMLGDRWQPWLSVGAGLIQFTPQDGQGRDLSSRVQTRDPGEDYNAIIPQVPLQAGLNVWLTPQLAVGLSYTYRFVPTDYLDNVGNRGTRSGFDLLQALTLSMTIKLGQGNAKVQAVPQMEPRDLPPGEVMTMEP